MKSPPEEAGRGLSSLWWGVLREGLVLSPDPVWLLTSPRPLGVFGFSSFSRLPLPLPPPPRLSSAIPVLRPRPRERPRALPVGVGSSDILVGLQLEWSGNSWVKHGNCLQGNNLERQHLGYLQQQCVERSGLELGITVTGGKADSKEILA